MTILFQQVIAVFDDNFQPTGTIHWDGFVPHIEMKKLRHELTLTVDGPDSVSGSVKTCLEQATIAGLVAAISASFIGIGLAATGPAWAAFQAAFINCAGSQVTARIDDKSHWITWDS